MTKPLRVLMDARMLIGRFSGVGRVVTNLVEEFRVRDDMHVAVLCGHEPHAPWLGAADIEVITSSFDRAHRTPLHRGQWEERELPTIIRDAGVDVYHASWNHGIPKECPVPSVLTVHDLIGWRSSARELGGWSQRIALRRSMSASIHRARLITTVSDYVRDELLSNFPVDPDKVVTVPNGVTPPSHAQAEGEQATLAPYALYVGGHEPRKNVAGILRAFENYCNQHDDQLSLRMTGSVSALCANAFPVYERMRWQQRVEFLGQPTDPELSSLYRGAEFLFCLSYDEGFGLPVLEAMAHGCPVIASNRASLPEVVGDAGPLVDPDDTDSVVRAIKSLRQDDHLRFRLVDRGLSRARRFRWSAAAESLRSAYLSALQAPIARSRTQLKAGMREIAANA